VRFPLEEKGKGCSYSYKENYNDVKYLTSFYFNNSIPAVDEIIEFDIPAWMKLIFANIISRARDRKRRRAKKMIYENGIATQKALLI
jgi:hypothetical protein